MNDKDFEQLLKSSLKDNLDEINFTDEMKTQVMNKKENNILFKLKELLNYEIEIPLAYVSVASLFLITIFAYNISGYFPNPEEISSFQMEWVFINLSTGV